MQRFEPALCQCSAGLLCCASGTGLSIALIAFLVLR